MPIASADLSVEQQVELALVVYVVLFGRGERPSLGLNQSGGELLDPLRPHPGLVLGLGQVRFDLNDSARRLLLHSLGGNRLRVLFRKHHRAGRKVEWRGVTIVDAETTGGEGDATVYGSGLQVSE